MCNGTTSATPPLLHIACVERVGFIFEPLLFHRYLSLSERGIFLKTSIFGRSVENVIDF